MRCFIEKQSSYVNWFSVRSSKLVDDTFHTIAEKIERNVKRVVLSRSGIQSIYVRSYVRI